MTKTSIFITIAGRQMSGITTLMRLFSETLQAHKIEVEPLWGIDGPPFDVPVEIHNKKLASISYRSKVVLSEHATKRDAIPDEVDRLRIQTLFDKDKGFGVRITMAGHPLESWFGQYANSKDKALMVATRYSTELDVDIENLIPREYDWVQPQ